MLKANPELQQNESAQETPQDGDGDIYQTIQDAGGPPRETIEQWKAEFPSVNVLPFSDTEFYIFRPIRRLEWNLLKTQASKNANMTEDINKERVVSKCLLWPPASAINFELEAAGLCDSLYEAVMLESKFYSPNVILNLVTKL